MVAMPRTARPPLRVPSWPWWAALAACVAGVVLLYAALVWSSAGQVLEYQVFRAVEERYADTVPDLASRVVRLLPLTLAAGVALASLGALAVPRWRRRGMLALAALIGANLTTQLLKAVLPRPEHAAGVPFSGGNSLPSGHMTLAAGAAVAALLLVPARWRPVTAVLGTAVSALTGAVAYTEAWHRPSDMAAAALVAAGWGLLAVPLALHEDGPRPAPRGARAAEIGMWTVGAVGMAAGLVLLWLTLEAPAAAGASPHPAAEPAGILLSAAPVVLCWGALATAFRRSRTA
ncbi:hypothetical protein GCM10022241_05680 [Micrococcus endophyticus]